MKIITEYLDYAGYWTAVDENYDGPPAPIGMGKTKEEAIADLMERADYTHLPLDDYATFTREAKLALKELDKLLPLGSPCLAEADRLLRAATQLREWVAGRELK